MEPNFKNEYKEARKWLWLSIGGALFLLSAYGSSFYVFGFGKSVSLIDFCNIVLFVYNIVGSVIHYRSMIKAKRYIIFDDFLKDVTNKKT